MTKACDCGISQASFFDAHDKSKSRKWCVLCPRKPDSAVSCRVKNMCVCKKAAPYMCLPYDGAISRWCIFCPSKPKNAVYKISRKIHMIRQKKIEYAAIILMQLNRSYTPSLT